MQKKVRRSWSPEEKAKVLGRFRTSGLSREAFARKEGISPSVVGNWLRKQTTEAVRGSKSGIVPVEVKRDDSCDPGYLEIVVHGGRRIRVEQGFDEELLQHLIATLERC